MIWVSSANCEIFIVVPLMLTPSISGQSSISRVSPSAIIRNASGENGGNLGGLHNVFRTLVRGNR
eukprot:scaffold18061_cov157-Isochrysis_galbana.AAC.1